MLLREWESQSGLTREDIVGGRKYKRESKLKERSHCENPKVGGKWIGFKIRRVSINCHKNQNNMIWVIRASDVFIIHLRRVHTMKPLAENSGVNFMTFRLGNSFLHITPKAQSTNASKKIRFASSY